LSEWFDNQKKPRSNFRQLLQERIEKANPRRNLTTEEAKRLNKLEAVAKKLKRGKTGKILFDDGKLDGTPRKLLDVSLLSDLGWSADISLLKGLRSSYEDFLLQSKSLVTRVWHG